VQCAPVVDLTWNDPTSVFVLSYNQLLLSLPCELVFAPKTSRIAKTEARVKLTSDVSRPLHNLLHE